jgi:hypothetical protein
MARDPQAFREPGCPGNGTAMPIAAGNAEKEIASRQFMFQEKRRRPRHIPYARNPRAGTKIFLLAYHPQAYLPHTGTRASSPHAARMAAFLEKRPKRPDALSQPFPSM